MRSSSKQILETALFFHNNIKYEKGTRLPHVFTVVYLCVCVCVCVCVCHLELGPMTNICFLSDGWMVIAPLVLSAGREWF